MYLGQMENVRPEEVMIAFSGVYTGGHGEINIRWSAICEHFVLRQSVDHNEESLSRAR